MKTLVFAPAARRDLAEIWFYTADTWGVDRADAYVRQIDAASRSLVDFPDRGSPVTGQAAIYRKLRSGSHRVIYRTGEADVVVLRILHERQDVPDEIEDFR